MLICTMMKYFCNLTKVDICFVVTHSSGSEESAGLRMSAGGNHDRPTDAAEYYITDAECDRWCYRRRPGCLYVHHVSPTGVGH